MKTFRQLCAESRTSCSRRSSINSQSSNRTPLAQSFKGLINSRKQSVHKLGIQNIHKPHKTLDSYDNKLFSKLIQSSKQLNENRQNQRYSIQAFMMPPPLKKRIKINRKFPIPNQVTPIRQNKKTKQQVTTDVELTSTQKKQIQFDLSEVTKKIKQRLVAKQVSQYQQLEQTIKQVQKTIKGQTQKAFERILQKREFICSSIKSKKGKNVNKQQNQISTPRFQQSTQQITTDRFETSLIQTIQQVLSKINIEPSFQQCNSILSINQNKLDNSKNISRTSSSRFSTKSIKDKLIMPSNRSKVKVSQFK